MSGRRIRVNRVNSWAAKTGWAIFFIAASAVAQTGAGDGDYILLVGSGFVCDAGGSACPAVVKSALGDSYEISGAGSFNPQSKLTTAAGTFTRRSSTANPLETGIWIASELVRFDLYGVAPGALTHQGSGFGPAQFDPRRLRMPSGSIAAGGLAVLRIQFLPIWGPAKTAILRVNCPLGRAPAEHQTEGITLAFEGGGVAFDEEVSGRTMFVLTRPGTAEMRGDGVRMILRPISQVWALQ